MKKKTEILAKRAIKTLENRMAASNKATEPQKQSISASLNSMINQLTTLKK